MAIVAARDDADLAAFEDLLLVACTRHEGVRMLERRQVEDALREQSYQLAYAAAGTQARRRLGQALRADILILMRRSAVATQTLDIAVADVATGLRVARHAWTWPPVDLATDAAALAGLLVAESRPLAAPPAEVVVVSPVESLDLTVRLRAEDRAYARLIERLCAAVPGCWVVEADEGRAFLQEARLAPNDQVFSHALPLFIHSRVRNSGLGPDRQVDLDIRVERGDQEIVREQITCTARHVAETLEPCLRSILADHAAAGAAPAARAADRLAEATAFWRRAQELIAIGQLEDAVPMLESALAVVPDDTRVHSDAWEVPLYRRTHVDTTHKALVYSRLVEICGELTYRRQRVDFAWLGLSYLEPWLYTDVAGAAHSVDMTRPLLFVASTLFPPGDYARYSGERQAMIMNLFHWLIAHPERWPPESWSFIDYAIEFQSRVTSRAQGDPAVLREGLATYPEFFGLVAQLDASDDYLVRCLTALTRGGGMQDVAYVDALCRDVGEERRPFLTAFGRVSVHAQKGLPEERWGPRTVGDYRALSAAALVRHGPDAVTNFWDRPRPSAPAVAGTHDLLRWWRPDSVASEAKEPARKHDLEFGIFSVDEYRSLVIPPSNNASLAVADFKPVELNVPVPAMRDPALPPWEDVVWRRGFGQRDLIVYPRIGCDVMRSRGTLEPVYRLAPADGVACVRQLAFDGQYYWVHLSSETAPHQRLLLLDEQRVVLAEAEAPEFADAEIARVDAVAPGTLLWVASNHVPGLRTWMGLITYTNRALALDIFHVATVQPPIAGAKFLNGQGPVDVAFEPNILQVFTNTGRRLAIVATPRDAPRLIDCDQKSVSVMPTKLDPSSHVVHDESGLSWFDRRGNFCRLNPDHPRGVRSKKWFMPPVNQAHLLAQHAREGRNLTLCGGYVQFQEHISTRLRLMNPVGFARWELPDGYEPLCALLFSSHFYGPLVSRTGKPGIFELPLPPL